MLKYLFFLFGLIISNSIFAQSSILLKNVGTSATLAPNQVIQAVTQASNNTKTTIDIKNVGNTTQSYNAIRYDIKLNSVQTTTTQAVAYFCIAGVCYGPNVTVSQTALTLNPGQSASNLQGQFQMLVADLDEASSVGFSHVKYTFINVNNPSDSVQISIKYNSSLEVGIKESNKDLYNITLYPNPVKEQLNLKVGSSASSEGMLRVFNSLGNLLFTNKVSIEAGETVIPVKINSLHSGVYFVQLISESGFVTKRFIID